MTSILRRPRSLASGSAIALVAFALGVVGAVLLLRRLGVGGSTLDQPIVAPLEYTLDSLPNGVRYYVYANPGSGDRTELRLVVDAGSVEEADDQRGLAHAVEHMVFRGTRRYPGGAIERYFDAMGMRRGHDVNAFTSLDDTQFRMTVPTARPGAIDLALSMLASMAHEATFDPEDARRERGVLLEEWRSSRDVDTRVEDARDELLHAGTAYAGRPIIGDTAVLNRFDLAALRRYYETWYRPELMAVVVVGDVDAAAVEAMVRSRFGAIPRRGSRRVRPVPPTPDSSPAPLRISVIADPEMRTSRLGIWRTARRQRYRTHADYRASLVSRLWRDVLDGRLDDAALRADSPIAGAGAEQRALARAIEADVVSVTAMKGETMAALAAAVDEMRALAEDGPTAAELEERRRAILHEEEERAQHGDGNAALAAEFVDHFLTGNAVFTNGTGWELAQEVLPTVTADDVRAYARTRAADSGSVIVVATTEDDTVAHTPVETIAMQARAARGVRLVVSATDSLDVRELLAIAPTPGEVSVVRELSDPHVFEWMLSNGVRVLLKPTAFAPDEVEVRAVLPGGASLAPDEAYASAYLADAILGATGVGRVPAPRLRRWLESTSMSLEPIVTDDAIELAGHTAPDELETFFQLLHLHLTVPRRDTVAFRRYQARAASYAWERGRDPDAAFRDSVTAALSGGDPRAMKRGAAFVLGARLDDALDFWMSRTANGAGLTVAITGDFTLVGIRPLVQRYLASIPRGAAEQPRARPRASAAAGVRHELASGIAGRARSAIGFTAPFGLSNAEFDALRMVREVAARALEERLREQLGGTYGVDVSLAVDAVPPARYTITAEFETDPSRIEELSAAAADELARLHRQGPSEAEFHAAREARVRDFDGRVEENEYWADELAYHSRRGWSLESIAAHGRDAEAMTLDDVRRACARYIPAGGFVRVTMRPRATGARTHR